MLIGALNYSHIISNFLIMKKLIIFSAFLCISKEQTTKSNFLNTSSYFTFFFSFFSSKQKLFGKYKRFGKRFEVTNNHAAKKQQFESEDENKFILQDTRLTREEERMLKDEILSYYKRPEPVRRNKSLGKLGGLKTNKKLDDNDCKDNEEIW